MDILKNPHRGTRLSSLPDFIPFPSTDVAAVNHLLAQCPVADETPLMSCSSLAKEAGVRALTVKDERERMGLGSFKALGAAYVVATMAKESGKTDMTQALQGEVFITPSAGNHGLSLAAGARAFGAEAVIYIAETVPESFAERLRDKGARVVREGHNYEASMDAALRAQQQKGWTLVSDTSWDAYYDRTRLLMEGYGRLADETVKAMDDVPSHIFLQAGVGGLAAALAAFFREKWGAAPIMIVVEPDEAPALIESIKAGKSVITAGGESCMGRLDCKEPSLISLAGLARDADFFVTISEEEGQRYLPDFARHGLATTPSGGAGLSAMLALKEELKLNTQSHVLCILSEREAA